MHLDWFTQVNDGKTRGKKNRKKGDRGGGINKCPTECMSGYEI